MGGDEDDDTDELEDLTNEDEENEGDEGPGKEGGQGVDEDEDPDASPDEEEDEQDPDSVDPQPVSSRQRRSQTRWQERERELAETRKRAEEAESKAARLASERQQEQARQQQAQLAERDHRRALMTPEERITDEMNEIRAQMTFQRDMDAFYRNDAADKAQYDAKASVNKIYKRHQDKVEQLLKDSRNRGTNLPREQLLRYVIGEEALRMAEQSSKPAPTRRKSVSKPSSSRGDGASTPGRRGLSSEHEARKKRLENIPL